MDYIWMYWEGLHNAMPYQIKFCLQTIERHKGNLEIKLLDKNSVLNYLPNLRNEWYEIERPAHRADYIRTRLVHKYGGMWLDSDAIALKPIETLYEIPENYDYACQQLGSSIGFFLARPGCLLLEKVMEMQDEVLSNREKWSWNGIGNELLRKAGEGYPYHEWPKWSVDEVAHGKVSKLFSKDEKYEENVDGNAVLFHICNEATSKLFKKYLSSKRALTSPMLISQIFRKGLGMEEPIEKESIFSKFVTRITGR